MKQATKMVLGAAAIVAVSAGVAGVTAYSMSVSYTHLTLPTT